MKLKEFNSENTMVIRADKPSLHINTKTGLFNISKAACELIELKNGDQIILHQDEEQKDDWYLEKTSGGKGFEIRNKSTIGNGLLFNNTSLARALVYSIKEDVRSAKLGIAKEPVTVGKQTLWPIITAGLKSTF